MSKENYTPMKNIRKVIIRDYEGTKSTIEIEDFDKVAWISCDIISGDEILLVHYEDRPEEFYDASDTRLWDILDDNTFPLYDKLKKYDLLDAFSAREDSCDEVAGMEEL